MTKKTTISRVLITKDGDWSKASADISIDGKTINIWFRVKGQDIKKEHADDALLAATLLPAMRFSEVLEFSEDCSERLLQSIDTIQDIFLSWYGSDGFNRVAVNVKPRKKNVKIGSKRGVASCFTGGVDSFHSFIKHRDEVTHLLYTDGLDIPLEAEGFLEMVKDKLKMVSKTLGKQYLEVQSNIRELSDLAGDWAYQMNGSAIASIGLCLGSSIERLYIPSTHTYAKLDARGTHALLDPLWSTEYLEIVHDGAEATRIEKVEVVANDKTALENLRVCWQSRDSYNCGVCEKCIRTMLHLDVVGKLNSAVTFKNRNTISFEKDFSVTKDGQYAYALETIEEANKRGRSDLVTLVTKAANDYEALELSEHIRDKFDKLTTSPYFDGIRDYLIDSLWRSSSRRLVTKAPRNIAEKIRSKIDKWIARLL